MDFKIQCEFKPSDIQAESISKLIDGINKGEKEQILLGATGTGKTFMMANVIEKLNKPTLVLAHNKTLASQLASEFQRFFPDNAVCYFVSYYDYYQPEAYIAKTDTYIEKETSINEEIDKYRHFATQSLLNRRDTIIVSSVSAIYGLGDIQSYEKLAIKIKKGGNYPRDVILRALTNIQYVRSFGSFKKGQFNVLGDIVEVIPASSDNIIRLEFWGDEIDNITEYDYFTGETIDELDEIKIYPAKHNVTQKEIIEKAIPFIKEELEERVKYFKEIGEGLKAERIKSRTEYDIEMLRETGYTSGIENYIRYLGGNGDGKDQLVTLFDYFPKDYLLFIDESHITAPQIGAMYEGNLSRKRSLVEYGFRLPSAYDNRPLKFSEFEQKINKVVFVSATPGKYEYREKETPPIVIEQVIRPTGLLDPEIEIRGHRGEMDDLLHEIMLRIEKNERVLVTTVTKKFSEELSNFFIKSGIKAKFLHSEILTFERVEILRELRLGKIEVIVGVNLLREGLDLPEVSLIGILDGDKQGFLRSRDSLIQIIGRAARNANGKVIIYADRMTDAINSAIEETDRRRKIQMEYNEKHGITPKTIIKGITGEHKTNNIGEEIKTKSKKVKKDKLRDWIRELEDKMQIAIENLDFEAAAEIRDEIDVLYAQI